MRKCSLSTRATPRTCSQAPPAEIITISAWTTFRFCPFSRIDRDAERMWAHDWLELLLRLQNVALLPEYRKALWRALELLASSPSSARTITDLINTVQEHALRDGLGRYSVTGPLGRFLDADQDGLDDGRFQTFEIETLMAMGDRCFCPCSPICFTDRSAPRRQTDADRARRSVGHARQRRLRREDRGMAAHAAQEECSGGACHPEPERSRQFASVAT